MYGTIEKFKDYCIANDYDIAKFSDAAITAKLNRAQMRIDSRYHGKFIGQREKVQAFEFPRTGAIGSNSGIDYSNTIPVMLENAEYETAFGELSGIIGALVQEAGAITSESKSLVSGMNKAVTYAERKYTKSSEEIAFDYVDLLIDDLLTSESKSASKFTLCRGYK